MSRLRRKRRREANKRAPNQRAANKKHQPTTVTTVATVAVAGPLPDPRWHRASALLDNGDHRVNHLEELLGFGDLPLEGRFSE
jgi:hypothetical protein